MPTAPKKTTEQVTKEVFDGLAELLSNAKADPTKISVTTITNLQKVTKEFSQAMYVEEEKASKERNFYDNMGSMADEIGYCLESMLVEIREMKGTPPPRKRAAKRGRPLRYT